MSVKDYPEFPIPVVSGYRPFSPGDKRVVGITTFRDQLIVACEDGVYCLNADGKFEKIEFVSEDNPDGP